MLEIRNFYQKIQLIAESHTAGCATFSAFRSRSAAEPISNEIEISRASWSP